MSRASAFHPSLNRPRLIMGIGTEAFGFEAALAVMSLNLQCWPLCALVAPLHLLLRWLYRGDPALPRAYLRYMKEADLYDPWVHRAIVRRRPAGFGKGLHC